MPPPESDDVLVIATLSDRSFFGEMSFLGERDRSAFATAVQTTKLKRVDGEAFRALMKSGDLATYKVIYNFARLIGTRLRRVENELAGSPDVRPRAVTFNKGHHGMVGSAIHRKQC